jgi:hypothetical protein
MSKRRLSGLLESVDCTPDEEYGNIYSSTKNPPLGGEILDDSQIVAFDFSNYVSPREKVRKIHYVLKPGEYIIEVTNKGKEIIRVKYRLGEKKPIFHQYTQVQPKIVFSRVITIKVTQNIYISIKGDEMIAKHCDYVGFVYQQV